MFRLSLRERVSGVSGLLSLCLVGLLISAIFLYAYPTPTIAYVLVVAGHAFGGALTMLLWVVCLRRLKGRHSAEWIGWIVFGIGGALGCVLLFIGATHAHHRWTYAHITISSVAVVVLGAYWLGQRGWLRVPGGLALRIVILTAVAAGVAYGSFYLRESSWLKQNVIENPSSPPLTMNGEGDGPKGKFFPSSAQTRNGQLMPGNYFTESDACQRCHADIYRQWESSAHHFSSFNNQWYRKAIEYMQDVDGVQPSKWCGGCHDPAVLYTGMMNTPIRQVENTPQAQAGLGCMMCHSIAHVKSTMGQADFVLSYPALHRLAASKNPVLRSLHDYFTRLNPAPHRRVFLKPFMRTQTAQFCSTCHKVHLDVPVNNYRWVRGFNEYDNWQASGVSGFGARSFYYPPKPLQCANCHMPLVSSRDDGNINGYVHWHSFPAANTALPTANEDARQLAREEDFLKGAVTVDIFALSPAVHIKSGVNFGNDEATTFAVGEEAETTVTQGAGQEPTQITAPLNRVNATVRPGDDALIDVVVRTRNVGHFFPGGTVDAPDCWLELKATDDRGKVIFWSGSVGDNGRGPVDPSAHFYRALLIDANGNPINKRNAWSERAVVYVHLIPPGAADTVHYVLHVPQDVGNKIKLEARLRYRKFSWWNTQFAFAGVPDPAQKNPSYTVDYDDRNFVFTGDTANVSGKIKAIPNLPIVDIDRDEVTLSVAPRGTSREAPKVALEKDDWTRWNDYGIGLLLQGDLRGARAAFEKITEVDPNNPDGWVNLGRVAVQEGDMQRARKVLEDALQLAPNLARANYFYSRVLRNDGEYKQSEQRLDMVLKQYPEDRVVLNDLGHLLFLQRRYKDAVVALNGVLQIDPEDLQAHYTLMLCYEGLGQEQAAQRERTLYLRFKADEASQAIAGPYLRKHPDDNNEKQPIHVHVSGPLASDPLPPPLKYVSRREHTVSSGGGR